MPQYGYFEIWNGYFFIQNKLKKQNFSININFYAHIYLTKPKKSEKVCGKCFKTENDILLSIALGYIFIQQLLIFQKERTQSFYGIEL